MTDGELAPHCTVIIVDDEPLARIGMRSAIERLTASGAIPWVEVVALAENGPQGIEAIRARRPDILLLDIVMPAMDGFLMLEALEPEETPPAVIFVTAFDDRAVRAFEVQALDFLVKPVIDARLREGLLRAMRRVEERRALAHALAPALNAQPSATHTYLRQLTVPEHGRTIVVPVDEIDWIEGDTYYVRVHANGRPRLLRERMQRLEQLLDPAHFTRCHRSALVRIELVREVRQDTAFAFSAVLSTGAVVPVSRSRRRALEALLAAR